ncbi:MAG TPA: hypothetical protein VL403_04035, partial [Candidatus Kryptonia bacterium]|nr:hypothetical protein [Candidatus Kryptonia bacterium]
MHKSRTAQRIARSTLTVLAVLTFGARSHAASFTPGNIVLYRVGDGSGALSNNGNPVFLDEYAPSGGSAVQSIPIGIYAQGGSGSGSGIEGLIATSTDGQFVVLTGYASTATSPLSGTACGTGAGQVDRVVGVVRYDGNVDITTVLGDFSCSSNPRSATSTDGMNLWISGNAGGARYTTIGSSSSTAISTPTNVRQLQIFGDQLYAAVNG